MLRFCSSSVFLYFSINIYHTIYLCKEHLKACLMASGELPSPDSCWPLCLGQVCVYFDCHHLPMLPTCHAL
jgi:hypothetical protein